MAGQATKTRKLKSPHGRFVLDLEPDARELFQALGLRHLLAVAEEISPRNDFVRSARAYFYVDPEVEPEWSYVVLRFVVDGSEAEWQDFHKALAQGLWDLAHRTDVVLRSAADFLRSSHVEVVFPSEDTPWSSNHALS